MISQKDKPSLIGIATQSAHRTLEFSDILAFYVAERRRKSQQIEQSLFRV